MAGILEAHVLNELRSLKGRARVTYPYGDTDYPVVQRLIQVPRGTNPDGWKIAFTAVDEQFTNCQLVDQQKISEDNINVEVLRTYERVPGIVIDGAMSSEPEGATTSQVVPHGTEPERGVSILQSTVQTETKAKASRRTVTVQKRVLTPQTEERVYTHIISFEDVPDVVNGDYPAWLVHDSPNAKYYHTKVGAGIPAATAIAYAEGISSHFIRLGRLVPGDIIILTGFQKTNTDGFPSAIGEYPNLTDIDQVAYFNEAQEPFETEVFSIDPIEEYVTGHPIGQQKSRGVPSRIPAKFRDRVKAVTTTTQHALVVGAVDDIPDPADLTGNQNEVKHEKVNDERYQKTVTEEVIDEEAAALEGEQTGQWGKEATLAGLVAEGTDAENDENVRDSRVTPIGGGKAIKETVFYPEPKTTPEDGLIGKMIDQDQDNETGIITDIEKLMVIESKAGEIATARRSLGWFVERNGQTVGRQSILICSKLPDTIPNFVYWDHESISLPDQLISISINWGSGKSGDAATTLYYDGDGNTTGGAAGAGVEISYGGGVAVNVRAGFSGKTKAKITRKYLTAAQIAAYISLEPYNISPSIGTVTIMGGSKNLSRRRTDTPSTKGGSGSGGARTNVQTVRVGPFLTSGQTSSINGPTVSDTASAQNSYVTGSITLTHNASATFNIPSSSPTSISSKQLVARFQRTRPWRMNRWIVEEVEVYAP